jgi:hypothetical protein
MSATTRTIPHHALQQSIHEELPLTNLAKIVPLDSE